ncbi:MAG: hypothetical protein WCO55_00285 [Candidatus Falkowbacteria bacterium]
MINKKQIISFALGLLLLSSAALAQQDAPTAVKGAGGSIGQRLLNVIGTNTYNPGTSETSMTEFLGLVINVILSLFGVIFIFLFILAGYNYMTAYGKKEKTERATSTMLAAIIGLIITIAVYAIWQFVFFRIVVPR